MKTFPLAISLSALALPLIAGCSDPSGSDRSFEGCDRVPGLQTASPVIGQLSSADCRLPADLNASMPYVDYYRLGLNAGNTIDLTVDAEFSPDLMLLDTQGHALRWHFSSTEQAHINVSVQPGTYYIAVSTSGDGQVGGYALQHSIVRN